MHDCINRYAFNRRVQRNTKLHTGIPLTRRLVRLVGIRPVRGYLDSRRHTCRPVASV
ncbi:hypothetical protein [Kamptonema formosum]|uniref:hypothetical protein n=1 Tax=Kamptonema formosum TaxID=331992 RepID=UPI001E352C15|nr:hypothetical protein [Oscillatoria sp. PCC 10802]